MCFLCAEDNELNADILKATLEIAGAACKIYTDAKYGWTGTDPKN